MSFQKPYVSLFGFGGGGAFQRPRIESEVYTKRNSSCKNGKLKEFSQRKNDCKSCNPGYKLVTEHDNEEDERTLGAFCRPYAGVCANGELKSKQEERVQDNDCGSCNLRTNSTGDSSCQTNRITSLMGIAMILPLKVSAEDRGVAIDS